MNKTKSQRVSSRARQKFKIWLPVALLSNVVSKSKHAMQGYVVPFSLIGLTVASKPCIRLGIVES